MTGLVLAGGRSSRMGTDKALLCYEGERLVDRVAKILDGLCAQVFVASGDGRRLDDLPFPQVRDPVPDGGPLAGLVAGLEVADYPLVAVVAVDMPDASPTTLRLLADRWNGEAAVVPRVYGCLQPLHAVWAASAAPALRERLECGQLGVTAAAEALGASVIDVAGRFARNLNTPADLGR